MTELKQATADDWKVIRDIAYGTWPHTFGELIPKDQIMYMLERIYSETSLKKQMGLGHRFILAEKNTKALGFASYELNHHHAPILMIHKLYLLPASQGMGIGKKMLDHLTITARACNHTMLRLKVFHKNDKATGFYQHYGFDITGTETIDAGNGYLILDHVMCKQI